MTIDTLMLLISGALVSAASASILVLIIWFELPLELAVIPLIIAMIIVGIIFTATLFKIEKQHMQIDLRRN